MTPVKRSRAVVEVAILPIFQVVALAAGIPERFRPGVAGSGYDAAHALGRIYLKRIVVRSGVALVLSNAAVTKVRHESVSGSA